ncbi:SDR family oxidoreductase [Pacificimonas sp. ICDLI1SI03]
MTHVIVTGGAGALGRVVVSHLVERGHKVAIVDLTDLDDSGPAEVTIGGVDLCNEDAVKEAFAKAASAMDGLDAVVNIAGGFTWQTVEDGLIDSFDAMYRINTRTAAVSSRCAISHLRAGGAIVNVGAAAAQRAGAGMAPYAASKAGVMALTQALAEEFADRKIRVNAILPTIIDTPTNRKDMPDADPGDWVTPEAAAKVIAFLISDDSACMTGEGLRLSL